jgi:subtilisin family serine protease
MRPAGGTAALLVVALAGGFATPPGRQVSAATPPPVGQAVGSGQQSWVTLITGDRVLVRTAGGRTDLMVQPAPRPRPANFQELSRRGDRYLLPADAAGLVQSGALDWELFNVTGLVRQGYDDGHTPSLPLLMQYAAPASVAHAPAPAGTTARRSLPAVGMTAVDVKKSGVTRLWRDLTPGRNQQTAAGQPARTGGGVRQSAELAGGVKKVWLNGRVHASLAQSVPQIGAPAAWAKGLTGKDVTVAVLDTGIDTGHPDLAGKVRAAKDFSGKGSVEDGNGHGTHVASTVVGTGAASDGRYQGVAPGATLAVGKVLDDGGEGSFDAVIAGMQWAAAEARARVVNLSLGGGATDGTDPVSAAVNTLTSRYGTLFVAASGNEGADDGVSTPAAADAALAVGSVSMDDVLSPFSNRGPRRGDGAAKPDLVAPGEGIVAARPGGQAPIGIPEGDHYQRLGGTSMATPHVAGAAALLAQQHPDWTADRLKAALMSTGAEIAEAGPYAAGAGRVDVARASGQPVHATGSVSTNLRWPNLGQSRKQTVTWTNTGTAPVALTLGTAMTSRDGEPAPAGLIALSAGVVTVPAAGSTKVEVTIAAQDDAAGTYGGVLTAASADGTVRTRTVLSVLQEAEWYDLTVNLINRDGVGTVDGDSAITVGNLDDSDVFYWGAPGRIRLPAGRYAVNATIATPRAGQEPSYSFISHPELTLSRDAGRTLDARIGRPASVTSDNAAALGGGHDITIYTKISDSAFPAAFSMVLDPRFHDVFAATVPGTRSPTFAFGQARRATEPRLELAAVGPQGFEVAVDWLARSPTPAGRANLAVVHGGQGTPEDLAKIDAKGKLVLIEVPGELTYAEVYQRTANINNAGARLALVYVRSQNTNRVLVAEAGDEPAPALPTLVGFGETVARFAALVKAGEATADYVSRPMPELRYELAYGVEHQVTNAQVYRPKTRDLAKVRTSYHDNAPDAARFLHASTEFFGASLQVARSWGTKVPQQRIEYFTPGRWTLSSFPYGNGSTGLADTRQLVAGSNPPIAWEKAVVGPTFRGTTRTRADGHRPWAWRKDGAIDVILPMYGDSAGRPRVPTTMDAIDSGSISLYRDGVLVQTVPVPDAARIDVPDAGGSYRLSAHTSRDVHWWPLATTVSAQWTFHSAVADDGKPLPLLTARFDPAVDLRNRAPGGGTFSFASYVERQGADRVQITAYKVDVSYDDGRSWQPATVTRAGNHWTVRVRHPAEGYASLRATATDAAGNSVRQTVLRAYQIGG